MFITINPRIKKVDNETTFEQLDYSAISQLANGITFLQYYWGTNNNPPSPVASINLMRYFIDSVVKLAPQDKFAVGKPLMGYDWALPYVNGHSKAYFLTLDAAITLANDVRTVIQFDDISQTPFFHYIGSYSGEPIEHIVWFIDARSINALDNLIKEKGLKGSGIWNIMVYYQQMWSIINSQYEILKEIPDNL